MRKLIILLILLKISIVIYSQKINLSLDNQYITLGESSRLTVELEGDLSKPDFDNEEDLELTLIGRSSSYNIINNKTSSSTIYTFRVTPHKTGKFTIPRFKAKDNQGNIIKSNSMELFVEKAKNITKSNNDYGHSFETEYVKLFFDIPDRDFYIGEAVEISVTAYFTRKYSPSLKKHPYITNNELLFEIDKNFTQEERIINGEGWTEAKWKGFLIPIKTGNFKLNAKLESLVSLPTGNRSFFSSTIDKDVITTSKEIELKVIPLPDNKPDTFTGAIGDFSLNSNIDRDNFPVGDPLTITVEIFGRGNFQRVNLPELKSNDNWKFYPHSYTYSGTNDSNYKGIKTFQQIATPKKNTLKNSPVIQFTFFNPEKKKYITLKSDNHPIELTGMISKSEKINEVKEYVEYSPILKPIESKPKTLDYTQIFILIGLIFLAGIILNILYILINRDRSNNSEIKKLLYDSHKDFEKGDYLIGLNKLNECIKIYTEEKYQINRLSITTEDLKYSEKFSNYSIKIDQINYASYKPDKKESIELKESIIGEFK